MFYVAQYKICISLHLIRHVTYSKALIQKNIGAVFIHPSFFSSFSVLANHLVLIVQFSLPFFISVFHSCNKFAGNTLSVVRT